MGFEFVTEIDAQKFIESLKNTYMSLGNREIIDTKLSTAAVPKPLPAGDGVTVPEFDFVTEYSALILWKEAE